jgi:hypothetical protein
MLNAIGKFQLVTYSNGFAVPKTPSRLKKKEKLDETTLFLGFVLIFFKLLGLIH